jgi:hypothetical protein
MFARLVEISSKDYFPSQLLRVSRFDWTQDHFPVVTTKGIQDGDTFLPFARDLDSFGEVYYFYDTIYVVSEYVKKIFSYRNGRVLSTHLPQEHVVDCWNHEILLTDRKTMFLYSIDENLNLELCAEFPMGPKKTIVDMRQEIAGLEIPFFTEVSDLFLSYPGSWITRDRIFHPLGLKIDTRELWSYIYHDGLLITSSSHEVYLHQGKNLVKTQRFRSLFPSIGLLNGKLLIFDHTTIRTFEILWEEASEFNLYNMVSLDMSEEAYNEFIRPLAKKIRTERCLCQPMMIPREQERISFSLLADVPEEEYDKIFEDFVIHINYDDGLVYRIREGSIELIEIDESFWDALVRLDGRISGNKFYHLDSERLKIYDFDTLESKELPIEGNATDSIAGIFGDVVVIARKATSNMMILFFVWTSDVLRVERVVPVMYSGRVISSSDEDIVLRGEKSSLVITVDDIVEVPNMLMKGPAGCVFLEEDGVNYCGTPLRGNEFFEDHGFLSSMNSGETYQLFSDGGIEKIPFKIALIGKNFAIFEDGKIYKILRPDDSNVQIHRAFAEVGDDQEVLQQLFTVLDQYTNLHGKYNKTYKIQGKAMSLPER